MIADSRSDDLLYVKFGETDKRPKGRTMLYRIWRFAERFPNWLQSPQDFFLLPEETQAQALFYESVREQEEAEMMSASLL